MKPRITTRHSNRSTRLSIEARTAIQNSSDSIRTLAQRYRVNPKTIAKWRTRSSTHSLKTGPRIPKSTTLSATDEALIAVFRQLTQLSLDDMLSALQPFITKLTRSSFRRCLIRLGLYEPINKRSAAPGHFHIELVEMSAADDAPVFLFAATEQASNWVFVEIHATARQVDARDFLHHLLAASPVKVVSVTTDDRLQFTTPGNTCSQAQDVQQALLMGRILRAHPFEYAVADADIKHHLVLHEGERELSRNLMLTRIIKAADEVMTKQHGSLLTLLMKVIHHHNELRSLKSLRNKSPLVWLADINPSASKPRNTKAVSAHENLLHSRQRSETREKILDATRAQLARYGPEGLSLAKIARVAGVNRGTVYQHFETREKLIEETAKWVSNKLFVAAFSSSEAYDSSKYVDPQEQIDNLAMFAMENPELSKAWLLQVLSTDPVNDKFWREYTSRLQQFAESPIAQEHIDSEVSSVMVLAGCLLWPVLARFRAKPNEDMRHYARRFADECLRLTMYGNMKSKLHPEIARRLARP